MSSEQEQQQNVPEKDEYLDLSEVAEEFADDGSAPPPEEEDEEDEREDQEGHTETIEVDLSNNSWTYFDKHEDSIFTIFSHPLLPMVVTGGGDNTAYLWTTHSQPPKFVAEIKGHKESVISGTFTADGKYLITADMTGVVLVHRLAKGGEKWVQVAALQEVEEVLWVKAHASANYFAFGAQDGSVWVYQIEELTVSQLMSGFSHSLECNAGVFIREKEENELSLVTISEDGLIVCWNCYQGTPVWKLAPFDFKGAENPWVTVSVNGNVLACGARNGELAIIHESGRLVNLVKTLESVEDEADLSIEALSWCKTLPLLAVGLVSGDVLFFETQQWRIRHRIQVEDTVTKLVFGEGAEVFGLSMDGCVYKWDARTGQELFKGVGHNMGVLDFALVEKNSKIVTAGDEGVSLVFQV